MHEPRPPNTLSLSLSLSLQDTVMDEQGELRDVVWSQNYQAIKRVPVLYYLSRNGQLEHPHFMEVPLSSNQGLFLKDVINRLNALRGKGVASMYSWSCKRSYKNGFVWHDLSENDLIYPAHGRECILKGSELPEKAVVSPPPPPPPPPPPRPTPDDKTADRWRRNHSCSSIDFAYNNSSAKLVSGDIATEADETLGRRRRRTRPEEDKNKEVHLVEIEVSTPPSDSSPETLATLMKAGGNVTTAAARGSSGGGHRHQNIQRCRSSVLMHFISCGSMPFKDCGAGGEIRQHKMKLAQRGGGTTESGRVKLEEKDYFSGSLAETNKRELFPAVLIRSNSYNADRSVNLEVAEKEIERLKAKCIPTKAKTHSSTIKKGHILHHT